MSDRFLLDTDVLIDVLNADDLALGFIDDELRAGKRFAISLMTYGELYEGAIWSSDPIRARARLEQLLIDADIEILPFTLATMRLFAQISGHLRKIGNKIGVGDILIAATALEHNFALVTRNTRHFDRIPDLQVITPPDRQKVDS